MALSTSDDLDRHPPSILLIADDHVVPWELARFPSGHARSDVPELIGAAVNIGRIDSASLKKTREGVQVVSAALVTADYSVISSDMELDTTAEKESLGKQVRQVHDIDANYNDVPRFLRTLPSEQLIHFGIHGQASSSPVNSGLLLIGPEDDHGLVTTFLLTPGMVKGYRLPGPTGPIRLSHAARSARLPFRHPMGDASPFPSSPLPITTIPPTPRNSTFTNPSPPRHSVILSFFGHPTFRYKFHTTQPTSNPTKKIRKTHVRSTEYRGRSSAYTTPSLPAPGSLRVGISWQRPR